MSLLLNDVDLKGYFINRRCFSTDELSHLRRAVSQSYINRLHHASLPSEILGAHCENEFPPLHYHCISKYINHNQFWSKPVRVLNKQFTQWLYGSTLMNNYRQAFGNQILITDEEKLGYGNVYWRLVRPGIARDVGPLHRDKWFWDIDQSQWLPTYPTRRIKTWIPLVPEPYNNGLLVVDNSHMSDNIKWETFEKDGRIKPRLIEQSLEQAPRRIDVQLGDALTFHDSLIHGGSLNLSSFTRISLEFTIFARIQ